MIAEQNGKLETNVNLNAYLMKNTFCLPSGALGRLGGGLMSLDRGLPAWVLDLLDIKSSDSVLEVGFGPGVGLELAAARAYEGWVAGVDPSETMFAMAHRRNRAQIEAGRVDLRPGTSDRLPFADATFDAAMTMNSLHLWPDPQRGLMEMRRTLRAGGRIAVAITRFSYASFDKFESDLIDSGFTGVSLQTGDTGTCALGRA